MPTNAEIFEGVQAALCDALGVDEEAVTPTARIIADLGAESIDFLDIFFRLEKQFNIKIPRGEFLPADGFFDNPDYVGMEPTSRITARGLQRLQELLPWTDARTLLGPAPTSADVRKLITVQFVCDYLAWKLKQTTPKAPAQ